VVALRLYSPAHHLIISSSHHLIISSSHHLIISCPRSLTSIFLIVTGMSTKPATHAPSQGAGQTLPVNSGKLFVEWSRSIASLICPLKTSSFHSGILLLTGQPEWVEQNGVPQFIQRALRIRKDTTIVVRDGCESCGPDDSQRFFPPPLHFLFRTSVFFEIRNRWVELVPVRETR